MTGQPYLPVPRQPLGASQPSLQAFVDSGITPPKDVHRVADAMEASQQANEALLDGRPSGGEAWKKASEDDARLVAAGKAPKHLEALMVGEPGRYAAALAAAKAVAVVRSRVDRTQALAEAREVVQKQAEAYAVAAEAAWESIESKQVAQAMLLVEEASRAAEAGAKAYAIQRWCEGQEYKAVGGLPVSPEARGHLLATKMRLGTRMVTQPSGVKWPKGFKPAEAARVAVSS